MNKSSLKRGNEIEKEITELQNEIGKLSTHCKILKRMNLFKLNVKFGLSMLNDNYKFKSDVSLTVEDADILIYARQQRIKKLEKEFEELK
ncbi:MAG: hypothetical protein PUJ51_20100 [Clostridiales bacterium]|uniref:hypothetical protein n=1 Tax=Terrisporobacter sp. TaxID=1965305 RepID=UPI002A57D9DE|nr:hypothetical protein [Terrisporobacter sp.]MDD7756776.1 hypothetical protein [Clostridiales bacterium]MDY4135793.1 hypothetical protein [Terrisporobacter sp.]